MKDYFHYALVLFIICVIASGILAYVNNITKDLIIQNKLKDKNDAQAQLFPNAKSFKEVKDSDFVYTEAIDQNNKLIGYTLIAAGKGYGGVVQTMVSITPDYVVKDIKVISQNETPGLGSNCTKEDFPDKFKNKKEEDLKVDKDGGKVISITGATITTRAITNSIRNALQTLKQCTQKTVTPDSLSVEKGAKI